MLFAEKKLEMQVGNFCPDIYKKFLQASKHLGNNPKKERECAKKGVLY